MNFKLQSLTVILEDLTDQLAELIGKMANNNSLRCAECEDKLCQVQQALQALKDGNYALYRYKDKTIYIGNVNENHIEKTLTHETIHKVLHLKINKETSRDYDVIARYYEH